MAITGSSNIEYKKDEKTRYHELDNVKDITKTDLKGLKAELKLDEETNLESELSNINRHIEDYFDGFVSNHRKEQVSFAFKGINFSDTPENIVASGDQEKLNTFANYLAHTSGYEKKLDDAINDIKDEEIKKILKEYNFELNDLRDQVKDSTTGTGTSDQSGNAFENDREGTKEAKKYKPANDYIDPYKDWGYANTGKEQDIANIYRDNKLAKYMEKVFDDEESKELRRGTFRVNLGTENGLAGIIIAIREAVNNKDNNDGDNAHKKLYDQLVDKGVLRQNADDIDLEFSRKDLKELVKDGVLNYKREGGLDNELNKVAKILSRAKRTDLDTFASLLQSKSDMTMAVKEWNNAKEMTGNDVEHRGESSLITEKNVLEFLCDFNSDGQVSAAYKRKNNKEQKNQGDVGVLFGQQVMFTIEQAIAVKEVELGKPQGEQIVISNIIKNMVIADYRSLTNTHLLTMKNDPKKCTKENLAKLINGSTGNDKESVYPMPEMKIFFLDAIKKINGGSNEVQPDLYDTLVGKDAESLISLYETETTLKTKLDEILSQSKDPATIEIIRKEGLVRVRETILTKIMTALDHVEITTNDGTKTQLQAAGVDKGREAHALKKELLEKTINSLIQTGIHYSETGGWRLMLGYGKEGTSKSGRTKRNRGVGGGVVIASGNVELVINLSGEVAEQYNHKRVINADLSQVRSAKYLGIEGGAIAGIKTENLTKIEAEAYAGINRQRDPEVGINQIDKQYRAVSELIFDVRSLTDELSDREQFRKEIQKRIDDEKTDPTYGRFVSKNKQHLEDDLTFMVNYMDANKFFGTDGIFNKFPKSNRTNSINALLDIIQSGNIESRRHDVIAGLHGKIALTKLSFGVTTNALTLSSGTSKNSKTSDTPPPPPSTGVDGEPAGTPVDSQTSAGGQDRFGIAGLYIGLRISTWKNSYVPNEAQYLFTQYETGQGIGTEYLNNPAKDLNKYGQYLIALYNDPKKRLSYEVDAGRLILRFNAEGPDLTLAKFLNIHTTSKAKEGFSLRGNVLTIGNVGDMAAYTITEAKGVRRILCLGSKKIDEASRVTGNSGTANVEAMKLTEAGNIPRTQEKITKDIINNMTGEGKNAEIMKTETAMFFDATGKLQKPKNYTVTFVPASIEGKCLKDNGTLTIKKLSDQTFDVSFDTKGSPDKLTINYIDQEEYAAALNAAEAISSNRETKDIASYKDIKNIFAMPNNINQVFIKQTEDALSLFDDHNQTLYKEFMESIVDSGLDAFIDATDYAQAFTVLKKILATNAKYDQLPDLKMLIEQADLSDNERMIIVDKFKTIFSYITYLSDGKADGTNLSALMSRRGPTYKKMQGPNGMEYPLTTDYRKTILANLTGENELTRTPVENLIGFTAFYRLNGTGRKYAMTPVGGTNVLMGSHLEESMMSINGNDKEKIQDRFIKNLDVNSDNKKMVVEKINTLLQKNNITITEKELPLLLTGKEFSIDSSHKIIIDINRVFYLLGECGNESLGMEIKGIKIQTFKNVPVAGKYTANGTPEKEYTGGMDLNIKSHSIASKVLTQEEKMGLRHHQGIPKQRGKETPPPPPPTIVDPEVPPPPPHTEVDP